MVDGFRTGDCKSRYHFKVDGTLAVSHIVSVFRGIGAYLSISYLLQDRRIQRVEQKGISFSPSVVGALLGTSVTILRHNIIILVRSSGKTADTSLSNSRVSAFVYCLHPLVDRRLVFGTMVNRSSCDSTCLPVLYFFPVRIFHRQIIIIRFNRSIESNRIVTGFCSLICFSVTYCCTVSGSSICTVYIIHPAKLVKDICKFYISFQSFKDTFVFRPVSRPDTHIVGGTVGISGLFKIIRHLHLSAGSDQLAAADTSIAEFIENTYAFSIFSLSCEISVQFIEGGKEEQPFLTIVVHILCSAVVLVSAKSFFHPVRTIRLGCIQYRQVIASGHCIAPLCSTLIGISYNVSSIK